MEVGVMKLQWLRKSKEASIVVMNVTHKTPKKIKKKS